MILDITRYRRRSIRLKDYDYTQVGTYFITICIQNRECLLGFIEDGMINLNKAGEMIKSEWICLRQRFEHIVLDEFIIMPNHMHGIINIDRRGESCIRPNPADMGDHEDRPYGGTEINSLGRIIQAFKSITTKEYILGVKKYDWHPFRGRLWQRNYYEHIIRNEDELNDIREYIVYNPLTWDKDGENKDNLI